MIKINSVIQLARKVKYLKKGAIILAHYPNESLCHFVKNQAGDYSIFDTRANGWPTKSAERFARSSTVFSS